MNLSLANRIRKKGLNYWDFKNVTASGIHKISAYPATMVPDMQYELINLIKSEDSSIANILDPFHGSGTTLVEGEKNNLSPIGIDINPLANLITKVKLQGVNKQYIHVANKKIEQFLKNSNSGFDKHYFYNIEKWYRQDFILTFSKIRCAIQREKYRYVRQYYWVCLINILKKYSNTRSSTFKLHIKEQSSIEAMENHIIIDFLKSINVYFQYLPDYSRNKKINLQIGKSEEILYEMKNNSVDLIVTSPPYGDNSTTVTYGQYSMLPIYWIDRKDLEVFSENLIDNYSSIDSNSLGGSGKRNKQKHQSHYLSEYLESISQDKRKKVENFVIDYLEVMTQMGRVLKKDKRIVLTLGDRRVDNKVVPLSSITQEFFENIGFELEASITRNIPIKRMPRRVSKVKDKSVESMNQEYVLILRKIKEI
ncbi:DNA methyltransferase [Streptococcus sanguinis]|uniref:site-specific DNA-methyltransferase (cytosine-N(4)-specific) n=1 Tax=Streptococcus sanguinis TaxID=1305 RepID=A0A0B7GS09_STRSA|nr:DNA methyltransferase [Streptococcus sanguinis]CEL91018.1 modification methylase [Streptococcus sanguinis]